MRAEASHAFTLRITESGGSLLWKLPLISAKNNANQLGMWRCYTHDGHRRYAHNTDIGLATPPTISLKYMALPARYSSGAARFGYLPVSPPATHLLPPVVSNTAHSMAHFTRLFLLLHLSSLSLLSISLALFSLRIASSAFHLPCVLVACCAAIVAAGRSNLVFDDKKVELGSLGISLWSYSLVFRHSSPPASLCLQTLQLDSLGTLLLMRCLHSP